MLVATACVGGVALWAFQQRNRDGEQYRSAHRLLMQLKHVSQHLPAGLDEVTLAQQALDRLQQDVPAGRSVMFLRHDLSLVPYAVRGARRSPFTCLPGWILDSMAQGKPMAGRSLVSQQDKEEALVPFMLGSRLVGVAALQNDALPFDMAALRQATAHAQESALAIDSGLLFAQVRSAATREERRRLSREIHDGIAQELASVGYGLDALVSDLQGSGEQELAEQIRYEVRRIVSEVRLSIFDLRADVQPGVGLGSALTSYVQQAGAAAGLTVHLVIEEPQERLGLTHETELLRIVQEAVTNVRRHAHAENLWVTCRIDPPAALLQIADDGSGNYSPRNDSFGLDIMRERADRIGADLQWYPREGGGTVVEVALRPTSAHREA